MSDPDPECSVCCELISAQSYHTIEDDPICQPCIIEHILPLFDKALRYEFEYPVTWGRESILHPTDFQKQVETHLGKDFIDRYERRETEYQALPKTRIYCKNILLKMHQKKVGEACALLKCDALNPSCLVVWHRNGFEIVECGAMATTKSTVMANNHLSMPLCYSCHGRVYPCCGEGAFFGTRTPHTCKPDATTSTESFITKDMVRGKDYQICGNQNCGRVLQLKDGCNHLTCMCGYALCFLCGDGPLEDDSGHWSTGMPCPRYNSPSDPNALFDDPN